MKKVRVQNRFHVLCHKTLEFAKMSTFVCWRLMHCTGDSLGRFMLRTLVWNNLITASFTVRFALKTVFLQLNNFIRTCKRSRRNFQRLAKKWTWKNLKPARG